MVILDEPYASPQLITWLAATGHPVLDNAFARGVAGGAALNLVAAEQAAAAIEAGERLYTNSENALAWISRHVSSEGLLRAISLFKDKVAMREMLSASDPDLFFRSATLDQLHAIDFCELEDKLPFVVKPARGFCSMGVYAITCKAEWEAALTNIDIEVASWADKYPDAVVAVRDFILEGYISGQEFALDAFFDDEGRACVLNVLRHDFASPDDTSDRMYVASADIVRTNAGKFEKWLSEVNRFVGARNVPVHAELRVCPDGRIRPIEFNALRFAGLGGTDIAEYAFGFRSFEAFLTGTPPNWEAAFAHAGDDMFVMSLLNAPQDAADDVCLDYEALAARFSQVLELRRFDAARLGCHGFLFMRASGEQGLREMNFLLHSDLREFLVSGNGADR